MIKPEKTIIGRVEKISFADFGVKGVHAKIDTGADLSSLWATAIHEENGVLKFKMFGKKSEHYTGKEIRIDSPHYMLTRISNSFGQKELRYVVMVRLTLAGRTINGSFSLSNRSNKTYPVLIGRKLLNRKFIVDVSKGSPLKEIEERKKNKMKKELEAFKRWEKKA